MKRRRSRRTLKRAVAAIAERFSPSLDQAAPQAAWIAAPRRVCGAGALARISYFEDGAASGLPVILLHDVGPLSSSAEVGALFEQLRGDRPVLAPDLRGYGLSARRPTRSGREELVRFVQDFIADVSRRYGATVDLVAVGVTGEIAAAAVARSSRHVRSLSVVAPTGFDQDRRRGMTARALRSGARLVAGSLARGFAASRPALASALLRRGAAGVAGAAASYVNTVGRAPSDPGIVDVYAALRVPACFVCAAGGDVPRRAIDELVGTHRAFRRCEIGGAPASPHVERPVETAAALRVFWRSLGVKPELRLIRGERAGAPIERRAGGRLRPGPRRRTWT